MKGGENGFRMLQAAGALDQGPASAVEITLFLSLAEGRTGLFLRSSLVHGVGAVVSGVRL